MGQMSKLQRLDLSTCSQLSSLPQPFGQLSALQRLNLSYSQVHGEPRKHCFPVNLSWQYGNAEGRVVAPLGAPGFRRPRVLTAPLQYSIL